jgi:hypothetical protein
MYRRLTRTWGLLSGSAPNSYALGYRWRRRGGPVRWQIAVWLTMSIVITGCGASVVRVRTEQTPVVTATTRGFFEHSLKGRTLARGRLTHGGEFIIIAKQYQYHGKMEYGLGEYTEEPVKYAPGAVGGRLSKHGMVPDTSSSGGAVEMRFSVRRVLEIIAGSGCVGPYPYGLAYGMLHDARDTVTARTSDKTVIFKKAVIPASLHADGVLVYAVLPPGQNDVVTRTPSGRVVAREHSAEIEAAVCGGSFSNAATAASHTAR